MPSTHRRPRRTRGRRRYRHFRGVRPDRSVGYGQNCSFARFSRCYEARDPLDLAVSPPPVRGMPYFLWWNSAPAKIFMGDTGSLALGGAIAALAIFSRTELLLIFLGGLFLLTTVSVILQVGSFKLTGKRVFRMAASPSLRATRMGRSPSWSGSGSFRASSSLDWPFSTAGPHVTDVSDPTGTPSGAPLEDRHIVVVGVGGPVSPQPTPC